MDPSPTIAIVGKPNVGKSALFNRLIGKRYAVVTDIPGTTRDRISQKFNCEGIETILIDTGGVKSAGKEDIEADVQEQAKIAIQEADLILFTVDISQELSADDFIATDILRKSKKPILLVANKTDNKNLAENHYNFYELGFGAPIQISAIHKIGIEELKNGICKILKDLNFKKTTKNSIENTEITNICILGKPNAGKSSLVNALFGAEKIIVSHIPGTTRDSIDTKVIYKNKTYNLIDTAGIRKRGKIKKGIEKFSIQRAAASIERSDIVVLLIDGNSGITSQDSHIAEYALKENKGLILAINKIDLLNGNENFKNYIINNLQRKFSFVPWTPIIFISAKNKENIYEILNIAEKIIGERKRRIATAELNNFFQKITQKHLPASTHLKKPKFMYASQVDICPPKFLLFFKNSANLHFSYPRYIENELRKKYGFNGTSIIIKFKSEIKKESKDSKTFHY